jgi:predicted HNH restriction endonuclease
MGCVQRIERSRATILRRRCPVCGETDIDERKKLTPKWRCRHAHQFETPTEEMIECWQYSALYPDTYVKLNGEITLSEVLKTRQKAAAIDSIVRLEGREIISRLSGLLSEITVDPAAVELSSAGSLANKGHNTREFLQEVEEEEFPEGALLYRAHITRERNTRLLRCAKLRAKLLHGHLCCEACGFDFFEMYGEVGEDYIECHHTVPVSDLTPQSRTQIRDIALLCANCHRIVHRRRPWLTLNELKRLILLRNDGRS